MKKFYVIQILIIALFLGCYDKTSSELLKTYRYSNATNVPQISAHRGGKGIKNYPENCLETLNYLNDNLKAIYEVDIAESSDGVLVLMHDNSLDRTTTGQGLLKNYSASELRKLFLVDDFGEVTPYKIPLLEDVLKWSIQEKAVLTLDIKRGVSMQRVADEIKKYGAEDNCIIITYSLEEAQEAHEIMPHLMLSVSARNLTELEALLKSSIPSENMIAFTGTRLSPKELYDKLAENDILSMLGTLGNLDGRAAARGDHFYKEWQNLGIQIMATDRPFEVYEVLK